MHIIFELITEFVDRSCFFFNKETRIFLLVRMQKTIAD